MGAQVSMHAQNDAAPGPPPSTWGAYSTKSEGNTGVLAMIDLLIKDLDKELTEAGTDKNMASLHAECDWLLKYFDARKEARAGEVDSLTKAKAVLSGADYSLVQTRRHTFLGRVA